MKEIFLSASVPVKEKGRGEYYKTADPYLIQVAVRELVKVIIPNFKLVWGGHPAITPMVKCIIEDLNYGYKDYVLLYQSNYYKDRFPEANKSFDNVIYTDALATKPESLFRMREEMLSRTNLFAAVFIGGMEGIEEEYKIFKKYHADAPIVLVPSTGGATRDLAIKQDNLKDEELYDVDFNKMFRKYFDNAPY